MDNNAIFNLFTKSVLQGLLDKVGGDYRTSWKKDKLLELLGDFDLKTVLNKMSTKQLKVVLAEMKLSQTGKKSVLIDRIIGDEQNTESPNIEEDLSDIEKEINEILQLSKDDQEILKNYYDSRLSGKLSLNQEEQNHVDRIEGILRYFKPSTWSTLGDRRYEIDEYEIDWRLDILPIEMSLYVVKGTYALCFDYCSMRGYESSEEFRGVRHGILGKKHIQVYTFNGDETSIRVK